jgi:hypothetical protein
VFRYSDVQVFGPVVLLLLVLHQGRVEGRGGIE